MKIDVARRSQCLRRFRMVLRRFRKTTAAFPQTKMNWCVCACGLLLLVSVLACSPARLLACSVLLWVHKRVDGCSCVRARVGVSCMGVFAYVLSVCVWMACAHVVGSRAHVLSPSLPCACLRSRVLALGHQYATVGCWGLRWGSSSCPGPLVCCARVCVHVCACSEDPMPGLIAHCMCRPSCRISWRPHTPQCNHLSTLF